MMAKRAIAKRPKEAVHGDERLDKSDQDSGKHTIGNEGGHRPVGCAKD